MRAMEMIWGIPLFLSHLWNKQPDLHHVSPFVGLLSQTSTFGHNLGLGWKFPTLPSEEREQTDPPKRSFFYLGLQVWVKQKKRKRKKNQSIKDWRKAKEKKKKKINRSRVEEKRKKTKEKERFVEPNNVLMMCKIVRKKENSNSDLVKTWGMHEAMTFAVTNQIFVSALAPRRTKEKKKKKTEKEKAKTPKSQSSHQNPAF